MTFRLRIDLGNAAFDDNPVPELARILREVAAEVARADADSLRQYSKIFDVNGNTVGRYALSGRRAR